MRWSRKSKAQKFDEHVERVCRWHKWFAWKPVQIKTDNDTLRYVWLETVGRKKKLLSYQSEYGEKQYTGGTEYCDEYDLIPNALTDNEIVDNTKESRLSSFIHGTSKAPMSTVPIRRKKLHGP